MKVLKRRRKAKTDYSKRIKLLKSELPRIVFRRTNRYCIAQYVISKEAKDKIEFGLSTKHLKKYGWPENAKGSLKSMPATYLLGLLIGKEILKRKLEKPITDFGMLRVLHKTNVCAFIKGLADAGIKTGEKEKIFPKENRIRGSSLKNKIPFEEIKSKIEKI